MPAWDPERHDILEYFFLVPNFWDIEQWAKRVPTQSNVGASTILPGCVVVSDEHIWLCMNTVRIGFNDVDIQWVTWNRATGVMSHVQQVFRRDSAATWPVAYYTLDSKPRDDYCPHCHTKLEWAAMAERCPNCWWVKNG